MTDYLFDPALYAEGHTFPSSGAVGNTLVQPSKGTGATIIALDAAGTGGLRGVRFSTPTGQPNIIQFGPNPEASEVSDNVSWWGEWKVPAAAPTNNIIIGGIRGGTGSTSMALFLYTSAGKFALADRNGTVRHTFATSPTPGSWYHCTVGAQRGTTGTAPASTNGLINGAFYPLGNTTPVDTPAALTGQDTGQVASRYARLGGAMVGVTQTTTPYINDARRAGLTTGSSAIIPPTVSGASLTATPADALGATDVVTAQVDNGSNSTDPVGMTDAVTVSVGRNDTRADTVGLTDAVTVTRAAARTVGDAAGLTDAVAASLASSRSLGDLSGLTDAVSATQGLTRGPADTASLTDAVTTAATMPRTAADTVGMTDAVTAELVQLVSGSAADTLGLTDAITAALAGARAPADGVGMSDAVTVVMSRVVTIGDALGMADAPGRTMTLERTATDTLGVTDTVDRAGAWEVIVADLLGVVDTALVDVVDGSALPPDPGDLVVGGRGLTRNPFTAGPPRRL